MPRGDKKISRWSARVRVIPETLHWPLQTHTVLAELEALVAVSASPPSPPNYPEIQYCTSLALVLHDSLGK